MIIENPHKPIYDERVNLIIQEMESGKKREEVAEFLGLGNWKSVDMHMRRRNFTFDKTVGNYVPKESIQTYSQEDSMPSKISKIISKFEIHGKDTNPREIATETGFENQKEMAKYMVSNGYYWDSEKFNYFRGIETTQGENISGSSNEERNHFCDDEEFSSALQTSSKESNFVIEKYLPLLEILYRNKAALTQIFDKHYDGVIPKYAVPGIPKTKSIFMSDSVSLLVTEFCKDKNLSQKEVAQGALIEFMRKYGYEKEVNLLLQKR